MGAKTGPSITVTVGPWTVSRDSSGNFAIIGAGTTGIRVEFRVSPEELVEFTTAIGIIREAVERVTKIYLPRPPRGNEG